MSEPIVEVFADVCCPFTHVGLRRFVERRAAAGRADVGLRVRAWPLEVVNGQPLDAAFIGEEVDEIRLQVAPTLFAGFSPRTFPASSLPALALAAAAYRSGDAVGEAVSLRLRDLLFEQGVDIADGDVLLGVAKEFGVTTGDEDVAAIAADHADGVRRGVVGSPHFFTPSGGFFCPALDISRDADGHLHIVADLASFEEMLAAAFGPEAVADEPPST
jgi:predicted DsbA family dithiol-disulfide isomerase